MASAPTPSIPTKEVADATVEVGRIFGQGGTDGLILYALILCTFLMFLVAVASVWLSHRQSERSRSAHTTAFAEKDKIFTDALNRVAESLSALAVAQASRAGEDAGQSAILARIEGTMARVDARMAGE